MPIFVPEKELMMRVTGHARVENSIGERGTQVEITIDARSMLLPSRLVGSDPAGVFKKRHKSGWTITGKVETDHYTWCASFVAKHRKWGFVRLEENTIRATSRLGLEAFWFAHGKAFETFDSGDI